ncbi:unnamed protein product, partial [Heterosigma akashiwo]
PKAEHSLCWCPFGRLITSMASQKEIRIKDQCKAALEVQPGDRTPEQLADIIAYTQMAELF